MAWWPMGPVCGACCQQIRTSPANCPRCGQHQVLLAAGPGGSRTCGPCAGCPPEFACADCSGTETSARRLSGQVTVPGLSRSELAGLLTEDSRWQLLGRCLRDPGIPLDVRTAGALLLLYGQFVSRLTRLTAADIEQHGPDTCLRLDTVPVLLPPRLAALVRAQLDAAPAHPPPAAQAPPALPRPLARTARRTPDPDPQTPPAWNRARPSAQLRARRMGNRPAPRGTGQPPRRPHPDRRQLGQPHPPRLDHLHRRTDKHTRLSLPRRSTKMLEAIFSSEPASSSRKWPRLPNITSPAP